MRINAVWLGGLFALLVVGVGLAAAWQTAVKSAAATSISVADGVAAQIAFAEMRDGAKLASYVVVPEGEGPWPCVLHRTPYPGDVARFDEFGRHFVDAGYAFVVQEARGRGRSQGIYRPYVDDVEDGYDAVEWVAVQPWCNGSVAMAGSSARGIAALFAAIASPPSLKAAFVVNAPSSRLTDAYVGGVFKDRDYREWGAGVELTDRYLDQAARGYMKSAHWERTALDAYRNHINIPIYFVGGWYDIFAEGAVNNFDYLQHEGAEGARGRQRLLMTPTGHGDLSGDLAYPSAEVDLGAEAVRWFDRWLKGEPEAEKRSPVRVWMMAGARKGELSPANRWLDLDDWPPPFDPVRYHLKGDGGLALAAPEPGAPPVTFFADPGRPIPTVGGANLTFDRGPMDQRAIPDRDDYLRFSTPPLSGDVVTAGPVRVELWVASDAPDTDIVVKLVDVYPDGYEAIVLDGALRLRYRNGREAKDVAPLTPGRAERIEIELADVALTFEEGHRIALHVASSSAPRFDVNPNTGDHPLDAKETRIASNTVFMDAARPSALVLPVMKASAP
ncbi:CocE/NonD family hydrolase [bacterium]|nr:CocE/NonD family hydrolase [bacterium]